MTQPIGELKDRLKIALDLAGRRPVDLANATGISRSSISQYLSGYAKPTDVNAYKMAKYLGVTEAWLIGFDAPMGKHEAANNNGVKIPVLGYVAAGIPIKEIADIIDYEEISESLARTGEFFALKIKGNSMEPRICDGDVVIVKCQSDVTSGDIAIVSISNEYGTCKKIKKDINGIYLIGLNPSYDPKFYTNKEVETMPISILGRVVENRAKF